MSIDQPEKFLTSRYGHTVHCRSTCTLRYFVLAMLVGSAERAEATELKAILGYTSFTLV